MAIAKVLDIGTFFRILSKTGWVTTMQVGTLDVEERVYLAFGSTCECRGRRRLELESVDMVAVSLSFDSCVLTRPAGETSVMP